MKNKISWKRVILFMIIGTVVSNIFRFDLLNLESELTQLPTWISIPISVLLEGSGVFLGALIAISLLRKKRKTEITFFGTSKTKGQTMSIIPLIIVPIIGVQNEFGMNSHIYGFIKNGIDGTEKLIILGVSILLWFIIIKKWEKENSYSISLV